MPGKSKIQISRSLDERIKRIINGSDEYQSSEFAHVDKAYILGFHQGNITNCVVLTTNYKLHHAVFPVVGLVFFKTSPSDKVIEDSLKSVREFSSSPNGLGSFKSDKNEHLFLIYSVDETTKQSPNNKDVTTTTTNTTTTREVEKRVFNFTKGTFVRRRKSRLNVLQDPYCPSQVNIGPDDLLNIGDNDSLSSADDDQIDHLIFFIHGVGGVCDVRFRSCVEVVADFKKMANNLLAQQSNPSSGSSSPSNKSQSNFKKASFFRKYSSESNSSSRTNSADETAMGGVSSIPRLSNFSNLMLNKTNVIKTRKVECLPISWHSCTRRQTGMNDQLSLIALSSVPKLRHFLNKVVMDALLYSSGPIYAQTIINNVGDEINRLYTLFMEKHPNFNGSISLAGHSLGSVIVFDLLANQVPFNEEQARDKETTNANNDNLHPENNNNNNNNNNNGEQQSDSSYKNARLNCRNVSHKHHNLYPSDPIDSCFDYKNLDELLIDMNLTQFADIFHKEHVDINSLLLLTDLDMKELNLPVGARRKLGTYINFKKVSMKPINESNNLQQSHNQNQSSSNEQSRSNHNQSIKSNNNLCDNMNTGQFLIKYPQLKFKPRCFFSFGSPMGMFLNIRGIGDLSNEYKLPTCDRMFNIFHPYDPLAYRLEPLIDPRFKNIEPIQIPHHRGGKRVHVQLREGFARVGQDIKHRLFGSIRDTWTSFTRFGTSTMKKCDDEDDATDFDSSKVGRLNCGRRLDYVLQEKPIELFNEYIFAFTSHANYWQNEDSALIILNEIYQDEGMFECFDGDIRGEEKTS